MYLPSSVWRRGRRLLAVRQTIVAATVLSVTAALLGAPPALAAGSTNKKTPVPATVFGHATAHRAVAVPKADARIAAGNAATAAMQAAGVHFPAGGSATAVLPAGGGSVRAGSLPVLLAPVGRSAGGAIEVTMPAPAATAAAGVDGMIAVLRGTTAAASTEVTLDYSSLAGAGGDYGARLALSEMPACAVITPSVPACQQRTPIHFTNDVATRTLTAQVTVPKAGSAGVVIAAAPAPGSGGGDYAATSLSPSANWTVGGSSGDFTWTYPLRVPPAAAGPSPSPAITYDSQSLDGRLPANNNQPSWIGDGFDLQTSYIERVYDTCKDEGVTTSYDECWKYDNATLVLDGQSTELIKDDTTGMWRPKIDNGSRIARSTSSPSKNGDNDGETWTVTTTDGTQYVFGMNELPGWVSGDAVTNSVWTVPVYGNDASEPCHASTFAASSCTQAWRWNLDYVVDPHGNTETFWYTPETNSYAQDGKTTVNGTSYTRGGYLSRIDYGQNSSNVYTSTAPDQVKFTVSERCVVTSTETCTNLTSSDAADWPDVPQDEICAVNTHCTASQVAPTFFTRKRLTNVLTQYWTGTGTTYQQVDSWDLGQSFPATGDGTPAALFLNSITHTGKVGGSSAENAVSFGGIQLTNRVDTSDPTVDPLIRWRVHTITSETGAVITIGYASPPSQCAPGQTMPSPDANTLTCYPQYWTPPGQTNPKLDWFQKYPVTQVLQADPTGGSPMVETDYTYANPAWHYDDTTGVGKTKYKTWSQWHGFRNVTTTTGAPGDRLTQTTGLYFQGMDGDKLAAGGTKPVKITDSQNTQVTDSEPLTGQPRETITYDGVGGPEVGGTITDKFIFQTASSVQSWGTSVADIVADAATHTRTDLASGGVRTDTVSTTYDTSSPDLTKYPATGLPLTADDTGDAGMTGDETCSRTTYAQSRSLWLMNYPDRVETVSVPCATTPNRPADVVTDTREEYDGGAFGAAPTKGNVTQSERLLSYTGSTPNYQVVGTTTYDGQGRALNATDALSNTTKTTYTPATGGPQTAAAVTDPLGHLTTTTYNPAWHATVATVVDSNNKRTDEGYDALGRLVSVWEATRSKANNQNPNLKYVYNLSNTVPSTVVSESLNNDGSTYLTMSITFYDAMLRSRQIQTPAPQGGRVVSQTDYNSLGQTVSADADYTDATAPTTTMANVTSTWPKRTVTAYDGGGRTISSTLWADTSINSVTMSAYGGDRTTVTPPTGGVATTTITDVRGNTVERDDYNGSAPTGSFEATKYTYTPANKIATMTDAAGNTWTYTYDQQNRLVKVVDPDAGTTLTGYDAQDNVTSSTDAANSTLVYTYDADNRKTAEYLGSVAPANELAAWAYDTIAKGQLTSSTRYVGGATGSAYVNAVTSYDAMYRVTGSKITIPTTEAVGIAGSYSATTAYNLDGTIQLQSVPAGGGLANEALAYTYNSTRQVTGVQGSTGILQSALYTKGGQIQQETLGVSSTAKWVQITNTYDDGTDRLHNSLVTDDTNPTPDANTTFTYDPAGNMTEADDQGGGTDDNQCFGYGAQDRLAQAWTTTATCPAGPSTGTLGGPAPYWLSWQYDPATGLRTQQVNYAAGGNTEVDYTYPTAGVAQPHALQTTTNGVNGPVTGSYGYNADGQTTSRPGPSGTQTLTWDPDGTLSQVVAGTSTTSNIYDTSGNLLISHGPTQTTLYVFGEQITRASNGTLSCQREIDLDGQPLAVRTNTGLAWLISDPHNTSTIAIDATTQAVTHRYETPFNTARGTPPPIWVDSNGFLDKPQDVTIGLTYVGAREYDSTTGRFISVDPNEDATDAQSLGAYIYAGNNPIDESDPTGRFGWGSFFKAVAVVAVVAVVVVAVVVAPEVVLPALADAAVAASSAAAAGGGAATIAGAAVGSLAVSAGVSSTVVAGIGLGAVAVGTGAAFFHGKVADAIGNTAGFFGGMAGGGGGDDDTMPVNDDDEFGSGGKSATGTTSDVPCHSFAPDTKVVMADGSTQAIKDVKVGDEVLSTDPVAGETRAEPVTLLHLNHDSDMADLTVKVTVTKGSAENTTGKAKSATRRGVATLVTSVAVLHLTQSHPLWDATAHQWVDAGHFVVGHHLQTLNGATAIVIREHDYTRATYMHDLTVAQIHTYYVVAGDAPVLVHNCLTGGHQVEVNVYGPNGEYVTGYCLRSGCQGDGSNLQAHTENRVARMNGVPATPAIPNGDPYANLIDVNNRPGPGGSVVIEGQNSPCPRCQGSMNNLARQTGANVVYTWPSSAAGGTSWWQALRPWAWWNRFL